MFGFTRKRKKTTETAATFVEATGGGWPEPADIIAMNGGEHATYVDEALKKAREYALANNVQVGHSFTYTLTDIPVGITGPHEIIFGLMMKSGVYGLSVESACDEVLDITRLT